MIEWLPIEASRLYLFLGASLAVLLTPGMAVLYIVGNSLDRGPLAGIVSSLGISLGGIIQVFGAALGVTLLLEASTLAPVIITYLGAGYFINLGIKRLKEPPATEISRLEQKTPYGKIFVQGMIVNLLNPKGWLFLMAFLPQFINPAEANVTIQMLLFGGAFIVLGFLTDGIYVFAAGGFRKLFSNKAGFANTMKFISGGIFILLGILLVVMDLVI